MVSELAKVLGQAKAC
jgi:hypothetical protein